ncbi:MAG: hypothetical protein JWM68_5870 [Verrucomicrobiales bacterium]|nr:hypothetical protein [Verrucomicrobiales bacterium]
MNCAVTKALVHVRFRDPAFVKIVTLSIILLSGIAARAEDIETSFRNPFSLPPARRAATIPLGPDFQKIFDRIPMLSELPFMRAGTSDGGVLRSRIEAAEKLNEIQMRRRYQQIDNAPRC